MPDNGGTLSLISVFAHALRLSFQSLFSLALRLIDKFLAALPHPLIDLCVLYLEALR